ncbi:hypothetical protein [Arthrobacter sp. ISL-5]|uniref:hypothetical protein n=1 Tax=Arthrobacter sp. ISL-5 TaxID=2819111 RepID=UPI001BE6B42C|nr:hypothetical protein [Arthrobacter sp. ISL-5]MBT2551476.1 hypothetical protein [Arthrobacter sp. ISL-5]
MWFAVAWGAGIALFISWGHPLDQVLFNAGLWALFVAGSWYFDARRQRETASRLDSQGGMLVYIRYPDSLTGSLSRLWNTGVASFDETSALKFQPAVYDTLEPSGRPTTFRVLAATPSGPRSIERNEAKYVTHRGFQVIRFSTDKGDIDVAGRPESLRKILDTVTGSSDFG